METTGIIIIMSTVFFVVASFIVTSQLDNIKTLLKENNRLLMQQIREAKDDK